MSRGIGGFEVASQLPPEAVALAGLVTQLGDAWFVVLAAGAVYLSSKTGRTLTRTPARDCLYLLALAVGAYSVTVVAKQVFGLPRPPGAATAIAPSWLPAVAHGIYESMVTGDGFGFPSGHALKSTVVYVAAALTLTVWDRARRIRVAALVVTAVAASRVALGVHYVVDVVAGAFVGVLVLAVVVRFAHRNATRTLLAAGGVGAVALALDPGVRTGLAAGVPVLALVGWTLVRDGTAGIARA